LSASGTFSPQELEALGYDNVIRILPEYAA
jgi:hypothetical protein